MSSMYGMDGLDMLGGIAGVGFGMVMGLFVMVFLLMAVIGIGVYVLQSLSLYTIAKRRGIHKPWLAWIPVGNMWILGSISDQYQYVAKGNVRNRRKVLLWLIVAMYALMIPVIGAQIGLTAQAIMGYADAGAVGAAVLMGVCSLALVAVSVTAAVFEYMAIYDLFRSCQPENSVMYLVLSIVFSITLPIFLFLCRNKDEGMPPRKQTRPAQLETVEPETAADAEAVTEEDFAEDDKSEE